MTSTIKEQEELIEVIKRPDRYYRIAIGGYGGEATYNRISEAAFEYWNKVQEEEIVGDLERYMLDPGEYAVDNQVVPADADFLKRADEELTYYDEWYDMPTQIEHTYGVDISTAWIRVVEQENDEYSSVDIAEPLLEKTVAELANECNVDYDGFDLDKKADADGHNRVFYASSSEKGVFFDGVIHVNNGSKFDISKLQIYADEMPNGDSIITSISYDGVDIDNFGGDTRGKGYYASVYDY
jgi:hypothetical protein